MEPVRAIDSLPWHLINTAEVPAGGNVVLQLLNALLVLLNLSDLLLDFCL